MICADCGAEAGEGSIDSGGFTPWGQPIEIPCPTCSDARLRRLAAIGAAWEKDSSLEKWFPLHATEIATLAADLKSAQAARDEWLWAYSVLDFVLKGDEGWETAKEYGERGNVLSAILNAKALRRALGELVIDFDSLHALARDIEPWCSHHACNARTVSEFADRIYKACVRMRPLIAEQRPNRYEEMVAQISDLKSRLTACQHQLSQFEASRELNKPCATTA